MNVSLTHHWKCFIRHRIKTGRFNNASEIVRHALRIMETSENDHLNPDPLPPGTMEKIYATQSKEEKDMERKLSRKSVKKPEAR